MDPDTQHFANWTFQRVSLLQKQVLQLKKDLAARESAAALEKVGRAPRMPIEFRSQAGEDVYIWDLFGGKVDGFYIEVGAFDGYSFSVTYAFEAMGWNGLLIEAIPAKYEMCRARRPHSRVVHAAVSMRGSTGTTEFSVVEDRWGGMLSFLDEKSDHAAKIRKQNARITKVRVPLTTLDEQLAYHTGPIDVAVLDVEHHETELLDGFDIAKRRPRVMLIEDDPLQPSAGLSMHMQNQPYLWAGWAEFNRVYIHNDEKELIERAKLFL